jgi:hypothetical protein
MKKRCPRQVAVGSTVIDIDISKRGVIEGDSGHSEPSSRQRRRPLIGSDKHRVVVAPILRLSLSKVTSFR